MSNSIYKPKYDQSKAHLELWIDKDIKLKLKQGAKRHGLLY